MIKKTFITTGLLIVILFAVAKEKYTVFPTDSKIIFDFCFFEKGEKLAIADNTIIKIFSTRTQQKLDEIETGFSDRILAVDISNDNKLVAFGGRDGSLIIKDLINKKTIINLTQKNRIITTLSFSPDSRMLAIGSSDGKVLFYDLETNSIKFEFKDHKKDITTVKFSPDGRLLATAGGDRKIFLYSVENGNLTATLSGHKNWVRSISFYQNNQLLSCGDDSKVILWNLNDLQKMTSEKTNFFALRLITSIDAFMEDNSYAVSGINGKILIKTSGGSYSAKFRNPIGKIDFIPYENYFMKLVAILRGKGVVIIEAVDMKFKNK